VKVQIVQSNAISSVVGYDIEAENDKSRKGRYKGH
jgi:hypothetical protein